MTNILIENMYPCLCLNRCQPYSDIYKLSVQVGYCLIVQVLCGIMYFVTCYYNYNTVM